MNNYFSYCVELISIYNTKDFSWVLMTPLSAIKCMTAYNIDNGTYITVFD